MRSLLRCPVVVGLVVAFATGCDGSSEPVLHTQFGDNIPARIAALSPEVSRVLLELGVGAFVVAADSASGDLPGIAAQDLGAWDDVAAQQLAALAPSVTIGLATARSRAFAETLEALGIHVTLLEAGTANEVDAAVLRIGALVDRELAARTLSARIARGVAQVATRRDGRSRLRVALVIGCQPLVVVGGAGLIHETLELAGAENVFHEEGLEQLRVSEAELAERSPEVVLDASSGERAMPCFDASPWGARVTSVPSRLAQPLGLDLLARVESLYPILYPASATGSVEPPGAPTQP